MELILVLAALSASASASAHPWNSGEDVSAAHDGRSSLLLNPTASFLEEGRTPNLGGLQQRRRRYRSFGEKDNSRKVGGSITILSLDKVVLVHY